MGCLDNLIGIDGSCPGITGRLYLKDVGIFDSELSQYLSEEEAGVADLLASVGRASAEQLSTDILGDMMRQGRIKAHTFVDRLRTGTYHEQIEVITPTANTVSGVVLDLYAAKTNVQLNITQLSVWPTASGDVTVTLYDMTDGSVLTTSVLEDCVANTIARKDVNIVVQARRQRMRVLVVSDMATWNRVDLGSCGSCPQRDSYSNGPLTSYGANVDTSASKMYANVRRTSETGGISLIASVDCDHKAFLCEQKESLAWPLMLLQAAMLMQRGLANVERIGTRQLNREVLQERLGGYVAQYNDARSTLIGGMYVPDDPFCFLCKRVNRVVQVIP